MLIVGVALATITTACSSSAKSATTTTGSKTLTTPSTPVTSTPIPAPAGLPAFYSVPQPLPATTGKLLKSEKVAVPGLHGTIYRVMYVSQALSDKRVAVTGLIAVPNGTPPAGGYPVVSWAHGTNGMADQCAVTRPLRRTRILREPAARQGLGRDGDRLRRRRHTGLHPYIAGINAAHDTIDIVRRARTSPAARE